MQLPLEIDYCFYRSHGILDVFSEAESRDRLKIFSIGRLQRNPRCGKAKKIKAKQIEGMHAAFVTYLDIHDLPE